MAAKGEDGPVGDLDRRVKDLRAQLDSGVSGIPAVASVIEKHKELRNRLETFLKERSDLIALGRRRQIAKASEEALEEK